MIPTYHSHSFTMNTVITWPCTKLSLGWISSSHAPLPRWLHTGSQSQATRSDQNPCRDELIYGKWTIWSYWRCWILMILLLSYGTGQKMGPNIVGFHDNMAPSKKQYRIFPLSSNLKSLSFGYIWLICLRSDWFDQSFVDKLKHVGFFPGAFFWQTTIHPESKHLQDVVEPSLE